MARSGLRPRFARHRAASPPGSAAAVLLLAVGAGALIVRPRTNPQASVTAAGHYATSRGQYATVRLIDGSEVTLGPESRLTISDRFAQGTREVALEGEAIFSVAHDGAHPFKVSAGGALIQDIGTRFDLRAYPDEAGVTVAVTEGSVSLSRERADSAGAPARGDRAVVLASGDVGTLDPHGTISSGRSAHLSSYFGWASGRLAFVDRPLAGGAADDRPLVRPRCSSAGCAPGAEAGQRGVRATVAGRHHRRARHRDGCDGRALGPGHHAEAAMIARSLTVAAAMLAFGVSSAAAQGTGADSAGQAPRFLRMAAGASREAEVIDPAENPLS